MVNTISRKLRKKILKGEGSGGAGEGEVSPQNI